MKIIETVLEYNNQHDTIDIIMYCVFSTVPLVRFTRSEWESQGCE